MDEAIIEFEQKLGVKPIFGGYHKTFGSKNALINLDNMMYLELLAADETNLEVPRPRWMGIDLLTKNQITRWALKSNTLEADLAILKHHQHPMNTIKEGSRITANGLQLQWQLICPLPEPEVELAPFLIDWSTTEKHPSELLPNMNCKLLKLSGMHPNPEKFKPIFKDLECEMFISKAPTTSIKMLLECPKGIVEI